MINVHIHKLHNILMSNFPKQHDFTDGSGRDAIAILRLLEFLDGNGLSTICSRLGFCQEHKTISSFTNLANKIVLLQPLWLLTVAAASIIAISHGCKPSLAACPYKLGCHIGIEIEKQRTPVSCNSL
ncbi:hypothetical protein OIU77_026952 [Salix suchowensis]|uniref:Uncharacterized protein n=1 Tax=Salix suchowensis TaxID=1278906 RepID=A0ABQ9BQE1_9ROSI|nr:hypothetical protein OIU77_026952 [Salix suchowensis]